MDARRRCTRTGGDLESFVSVPNESKNKHQSGPGCGRKHSPRQVLLRNSICLGLCAAGSFTLWGNTHPPPPPALAGIPVTATRGEGHLGRVPRAFLQPSRFFSLSHRCRLPWLPAARDQEPHGKAGSEGSQPPAAPRLSPPAAGLTADPSPSRARLSRQPACSRGRP